MEAGEIQNQKGGVQGVTGGVRCSYWTTLEENHFQPEIVLIIWGRALPSNRTATLSIVPK